jgi:hypothetical protein
VSTPRPSGDQARIPTPSSVAQSRISSSIERLANDVITKTVYWFNPDIFIPILGVWEMAIGLCLLYAPFIRAGLFLLALQMPGTFLPLILLPEVCFVNFPFDLTLEGQYIVKNLVLIGAAMVVGGRLVPLHEKPAN